MGTTAFSRVIDAPTIGAYTSNPESSAYVTTGATTDIASKAELNLLRVAYENLRVSYDDLRTKLLAAGIVKL